jgi:hypothetical protein
MDHQQCSFERLINEFCDGQSYWQVFQLTEQVERRLAHLRCAFDTGSKFVTMTNLIKDLL